MKKFFNPASVAVVGASKRRGGSQTIRNLLFGYDGDIFLVNPRHKEIHGLPCFPSIDDIPSPVDLAILIVPAPVVPSVLEACARKGVFRVMIESGGYAEVGDAGKKIQDQCLAIAREAGIRIWGPNCMGLVDIPGRNFLTFMSPRIYEDNIIDGRVSLIVQSGMLSAGFLVDLMSQRNIGVCKICSIGNKADIDECDVLPYLLDDPETSVVALYLESIPRGRLLVEILRKAGKPVVVLKGGKSKLGARAAMSHTASLAGDARLLSDVLESAGVTLATDFHQMVDLARALAITPGIPSACRIAVVSFSGAAGILSCDLLEKYGLGVSPFSSDTISSLEDLYPGWMPVGNPVDLFPAMELHWRESPVAQAVSILLKDPNVDVLLVYFVAGLGGEKLDLAGLKKKADQEGKVIVFWLLGRHKAQREFRLSAQECGILVYDEISRAIECLSAAARFQGYETSKTGKDDIVSSRTGSESVKTVNSLPQAGVLDEYESKKILKNRRIPVVDERIVTTVAEAKTAVYEMGFPVVLKGLLPGEIHKTDLGLVKLGIANQRDLDEAFQDVRKKLDGHGKILIQSQIDTDYELVAGFLRDAQFGPCVMFGLGGIFSELQPDVRFALAPIKHSEALKLMDQIRGKKILTGFRGVTPLKIDAMADLIVRLSHLGADNPDIEQIDINPVAITAGNPVAVDATMILRSERIHLK
ncbi:MAG: acetate--CoA ligase family protein [Deltaproteobacteria bacterium]|nr:acetate--CoA ligase family protein [Deltaproteobacteria bacterium]